ncbi:MAG: hypothetical protein M0000_13635 [Actinomycetota bacterium]|nr:hypothetical protein [Actinomycetota bacterium]
MEAIDFGPQAAEVVEFVTNIDKLTPYQAWGLAATYESRSYEFDGIWRKCRREAVAGGLGDASELLMRELGEPSYSVALALLVRHRISTEEFESLTAPWIEDVGPTWERPPRSPLAGSPRSLGEAIRRSLDAEAQGRIQAHPVPAASREPGLRQSFLTQLCLTTRQGEISPW